MNKALIITPTGCPYYLDDEFDKENHWVFRKPGRTYETCAVIFNDFEPEPGTYDMTIRHKGLKWNMLPEICDIIKWENYDYIGYWDDDYCTDIESLELALDIARKRDLRFFQQSLTSWTVYPILEHNPNKFLSETNFIELGVPFFRNDIFRKVLRLLNDYTYKESDWGIDKILSHYLGQTAHVIHASRIKHMRRESSYSKEAGFREMDYLMKEWYPKYSMEKFNKPYEYLDAQIEYGYYEVSK